MALRVKEWSEKYMSIYGQMPVGLIKSGIMDAIALHYMKPSTLLQQPVMTPHKLIDLPLEEQKYIMTSDEWGAQEKLNGIRAKLHVGLNGSRTDYRNRSELTALHVEKTDNFPSLKSLIIPSLAGTIFDGEIRFTSKSFLVVDGVMSEGSLLAAMALSSADPYKAVAAQETQGFVDYTVYDIIRFKGELVMASFKKRYELLQKIFSSFRDQFLASNVRLLGLTLDKEALFKDVCSKVGGEGIILRHLNSNFYESGKRAHSILKKKKTYYYDVVISGYSESVKGRKFEGLIGSLEVSAFNEKGEFVVVGHVSPGLDTVRKKISNLDGSLRKELYGKVMEISCMGFTPGLLMYHTAPVRFRFDKSADDCIIDFEPIKKQFLRYKYK